MNFHNVWLCVSIINHVSFQQEAERLPWTAAGALAASPVGVPTLWDCIDDWIFNFLILSSNIVRLHWILTKGHFLTLVTFWKPGKKWVLEIREFQRTYWWDYWKYFWLIYKRLIRYGGFGLGYRRGVAVFEQGRWIEQGKLGYSRLIPKSPEYHCAMCCLASMFTSQPNKLRHVLKFVFWYTI